MHAQGYVWQSVRPSLMSGDTVSAGEKVMCIRLTPSVGVKSDTSFFSQGELNRHFTHFQVFQNLTELLIKGEKQHSIAFVFLMLVIYSFHLRKSSNSTNSIVHAFLLFSGITQKIVQKSYDTNVLHQQRKYS